MKYSRLLALVFVLYAVGCSCRQAGIELWRNPSDLQLVNGHMLGDHNDILRDEGVVDDPEPEILNPTGGYGTDTLREMYKLFGASSREQDYCLISHALLAMPLAGHDNGVQLFLRTENDLRMGVLRKIASRRYRRLPPIQTEPGYIAIDTHVHTCYSHDSLADVSQVLMAAHRRGLAGVAITDHGTTAGAHEAEKELRRLVSRGKMPATFFIIHGEEVGSSQGHIIGLFLTHDIVGGMTAEQTIAAIHAQGGIAIAAHPFISNSVGKLAADLPFDAVETKNEAEALEVAASSAAGREAHTVYANLTKPQIGASDAHDPGSVGLCYTVVQCDPSPESVRTAILQGKTTACSALPRKNKPETETATPQKRSLLASIVGLDKSMCKFTRATQADVAVWPQSWVKLYWTVPF